MEWPPQSRVRSSGASDSPWRDSRSNSIAPSRIRQRANPLVAKATDAEGYTLHALDLVVGRLGRSVAHMGYVSRCDLMLPSTSVRPSARTSICLSESSSRTEALHPLQRERRPRMRSALPEVRQPRLRWSRRRCSPTGPGPHRRQLKEVGVASFAACIHVRMNGVCSLYGFTHSYDGVPWKSPPSI